jgi:pectinesterase
MKNTTITSYNAVVNTHFTGSDGEKVNGIETYKTVTAALEQAPKTSKTEYVIFIKSGHYHEKITVCKPNITFMGENMSKTKLTYDAANSTKKPDGTTYGTMECASVSVIAENFKAENITFENSFDYPKNKSKADTDSTKLSSLQAVALSLDKGSNHAYIKDCKLTGYQCTLCANSGTQYFTNCNISGCIDIIFGAGQAFF